MGSLPSPLTLDEECVARANELVGLLASTSSRHQGHGSMTVTVYDTAWLSMITKPIGPGSECWLFPQCFCYVLREQQPSGSWPAYASPVDGILNSLAGLLSLVIHSQKKNAIFQSKIAEQELFVLLQGVPLDVRISKAKDALAKMLQSWEVASCVHVGFEILVPSFLEYLSRHGIEFQFPGRQELFSLNASKLRRFKPELVYSMQTSLHHSLEAFVGKIDFSQVSRFKINGSLFASPSSTAAYLINLDPSRWDEEAEAYLQSVASQHPMGAVPSAFPSTIFECSWALSTLLSSGFSIEALGASHVRSLTALLTETQEKQDGLLGFIPGVLADADDTAKSLFTLQLCGNNVDQALERMVAEFENEHHFKTYRLERNASFSANCNILLSLLEARDFEKFSKPILKAITFLCTLWESGSVSDKWNLSAEYCYMLLTQAFIRFLEKWNISSSLFTDEDLVCRVSVVAFQCLQRLLHSQSEDGSWGSASQIETSSYALITLSKNLALPYDIQLRQRIRSAISRTSHFLLSRRSEWNQPNFLWVEKVTYGSSVLTETYSLSAMYSTTIEERHVEWGTAIEELLAVSLSKSRQLSGFYSQLPIFRDASPDKLHDAITESNTYYHRLSRLRHTIFPRENMSEDKYLQHIPLTWTSCNAVHGFSLPGHVLWEMMVLSMLNYQVDEYMETVVAKLSKSSLEVLSSILRGLCGVPDTCKDSQFEALKSITCPTRSNGHVSPSSASSRASSSPGSSKQHSSLQEVENVLGKYINHIMNHPCSLSSPQPTRDRLGVALFEFLTAHMIHNADNDAFATQRKGPHPSAPEACLIGTYSAPRENYFSWVRGTAADHTSCPFSFIFFCCLISKPGEHCLSGVREVYTGQALCRHLATLCRQYNDYGSLDRDQAEGNLNSLNFPDFGASEEQRGRQQLRFLENTAGIGSDPRNGDGGGLVAQNSGQTHPNGEPAPDSKNDEDDDDDEKKATAKADLMHVAQLERNCMELCMRDLESLMSRSRAGQDAIKALRVFVSVTDLYGQIYVAKDIASRVK